ncbi:uncharacterized protein PAC_06778 [Phialocephala subalpina]|uniref:Pathway-specific nitrogen regulator n=1 Tax=Phialocephala subalpina TaxID=576137 RepID=A0A1L7WVT1_9HELO|nr:uncharacterized protein PAC_06778 [Phialocephala subalpina]
MRKTPPPQDFEIHVDSSCLSEPTQEDTTMSAERIPSNESSQTVVHHDSWTEEELKNEAPANEHAEEEPVENHPQEEDKENSPPPADIDVKEKKAPEPEAVDESHDAEEPTEEVVEPEVVAEEPQTADEEEDDKEREARERRIQRIEAEIQAAARAVVANIHHDHYEGHNDSVLSSQTDESYNQEATQLSYEGTELSHEDDKEDSFVSDHETPSEHHSDQEGGDSSSHHDGDVDDDVFSSSDRSKRSSMDSLHSSDENQKLLTSPMVGEEAASANEEETMSRIPSMSSYIHTPTPAGDHTPSKVLSRPPFRTPSSVRAMQMSSPTPSLFSSPRSTKRHLPTVSRIGTPNSQYSPSKRTPTRLKPRKPAPLVLLHVTVLPLQWPYSYLMSSSEIPESLQHVKESWRLLQDKVGDTVLERGILLSHPQESYEVLEERLYEALELPVRPRARILKCGHYMGPLDAETPSSDEENDYFEGADIRDGRKWCDICGRDVRVEEVGDLPRGEKRFTVKIYASNGLMRAGAWEAAWREMERVDVELEPFVDANQRVELEHLKAITPQETHVEEAEDDGFVDEVVEVIEHVHDHTNEQERKVQEARAREKEEMIERMAQEDEMKQRIAEEEEMKNLMAEEEELKRRMAEEDAMRRHMDEQEHIRQNEERMREVYSQQSQRPSSTRRNSSRSSVHDDSSLPELLLAACKVVLRDSKNIAIGALSVLVILLAITARPTHEQVPHSVVMDNVSVPQITTTVFKESPMTSIDSLQSTTEQVIQFASKATELEAVSQVTTTVIREYTVTEKVPVATSAESIEVLSSILESVSVSQVTTTVFREKTVTERVLAPTSADAGADPCETIIAPKNQVPVIEAQALNEEELELEQAEVEESPETEDEATNEQNTMPEIVLEDETAQKVFGPNIEPAANSEVADQVTTNLDIEVNSATEEA